jgi:hypothetical protein
MQFGAGFPQYLVGVAEMHLHSSCILQGPALNMVSTLSADFPRPGLASIASYPALG